MSSSKSFLKVKKVVENWWHNLQFERKCNSTNSVQKIVNNSSLDIQKQVQQVICLEIKKLLDVCFESKNPRDLQCTCNAINGCFDNFIHAIESVRVLFVEVVSFIDFGLAECHDKLYLKSSQKNAVLELLHSLSRILILVLKLKRTQNIGKVKKAIQEDDSAVILQLKDNPRLLPGLTLKIGQFLMMEDILIDTKNNLSMSGILIREILVPDEDKLKEFHKNFVQSIPTSLSDEKCRVVVLKFLISSAIINMWSVNIIDSDSTYSYLRFFISLCEKYSSETPIVLNTSRTLLLLIKHESFKNFIKSSTPETVDQIVSNLLSCIFMLLEHPVACVRHSAKDFLQLLVAHPSLVPIMIDSVMKLPMDKRSYFISIGAVASEIGSEVLIKNNPQLPVQLISALYDPTIVSHVSLALEFVILKDSLAEKDFPKWCETYIVPLLISLMSVPAIVAAEIEKLLQSAFKKYPNSVVYIIDKWAGEELRYVITALKISQKQGLKFKNHCNNSAMGNEDRVQNLLSERLLEPCLHQRDDFIRVSAFSLLIEAHKTTKLYSERDFNMILYFLKYNLNNQQPETRQKILGLIRKMLVRFSKSKVSLLKPIKSKEEVDSFLSYNQFLDTLVEFCFSNIFVGCNFNRLNTVLNTLLLCFENIDDMSFNSDKTNFYWSKFLIALDSSYEENKELAVELCKKLDFSLLNANNTESAKLLYEKAFNLCTHMEPPDVLTGAYLLQVLIKLPSSREVLSTYFVEEYNFDDIYYCCIKVLTQKLKEQIQLAKLDLMTAATCGPMYGALFAIRLTFKNVDFPSSSDQVLKPALEEWARILNELIELCFDMTRTVGVIVNSSSPEGHLPMDFQTHFENLMCGEFSEKCGVQDSEEPNLTSEKQVELIESTFSNFRKQFIKLKSTLDSPDCDTYECLRSFSTLLKENRLLIKKIKPLNDQLLAQNNTGELLNVLYSTEKEILAHLNRLEKLNTLIEWPATAQVLLLCAWRSIKEASLYLGDLFTKLPVEKEIELGLLTKNTLVKAGEELKTLLCEIKHRGAFEHAYIGFTQLVNSLWKCSDKNLSGLPKHWLEDITNQLKSPLSDQRVKLCSTRRSAGLPFLVQAIICSEVVSLKSITPSSLHTTMNSLLRITENGVSDNPDSKIHALNVLRALFKHAQLGEHVASYVSSALMVAIRGSRGATWSERNSSSLLFSSLIIRIFGVSRSRDEISKKNRMTSRTFFLRYSELYDFLLSEMELVYSDGNHTHGVYPKPSLYLVLLILGRLYPPPTEDPDNIDLSEFLPYIDLSRRNPVMKIRELGARALVPLISLDRLIDVLDNRFYFLSLKDGVTENERHGVLLQVKELLSQSQEALQSLCHENSTAQFSAWIERTKWMLQRSKQTSLITLSIYLKVLFILYKTLPILRQDIYELITKTTVPGYLLELNQAEQRLFPGIYLFLENFYFLKTNIQALKWLNCNDPLEREKFINLFIFMLNCKISEVQSIPLRIMCYALKKDPVFGMDFDDDDFNGIGAPVADLEFFLSIEKTQTLQTEIFKNYEVLKLLTCQLNNDIVTFKSTVNHRICLMLVSNLVMNNVITLSHSDSSSGDSLKIDFAKSLIKSGDKNLSTSALICYAIYLMEEMRKDHMTAEDRSLLANILNEFSSSEADVKERLAVSKILNKCFSSLVEKHNIDDPFIMQLWMLPFKLLVDEDPGVRLVMSGFVHKVLYHINGNFNPEKLIIKMKTLEWPNLPLVSLKAQECLLDAYINLLGYENLLGFIVQLVVTALSSLCNLDNDSYTKDEFGVFEKGNPNPFCEDLALSSLMCQKLTELHSIIDLDAFLWLSLDDSSSKFISDSLRILDLVPQNLMEAVEKITTVVEETEKSRGDYSLPKLQVRNIRKALKLPEFV